MKKHFSLGLVLALMIGILAACGGGSGSGNTSTGGDDGGSSGEKSVTLKLSHQWPKPTNGEGDFRAVLAQKFAEKVEEKSGGSVKVQIYPSSSLVKSKAQYDAMLNGSIDMSVYPLDYAGGKVPQYGITLMPALIKNHKQAQAWQTAEIGKKLEAIAEENGVKILVWCWNAGAIGAKGDPVVSPSDVKDGMVMRAAGDRVEAMLKAAGAGITSMSSSEMYQAFQTGVLDAGVTSNSSFASYKLYEQVDSYTNSLENTFWFMFEPLLISMDTWDKLSKDQQKAIEETAAELQPWVYEASAADDKRVSDLFKEKGVNVVPMPDEAYQQWVELAKPIWDDFANNVEGGKELMELAKKTLPNQ
ncbi:MAG TPA: TRAP transporter substrate-binding protein DctP [Bacillales bacterium]|nr:TRAP transporter substrate-binding protein DctP [Bacillales bacterium]